MEGAKPVAGMVLVQVVFAGVNIFYKLALNDGMDSRILVAYRYLFAAAFVCPLSFFLERQVLMVLHEDATKDDMEGVDAIVLQRPFRVLAKLSMTNLIPAITFILAVLFRLESLAVLTVSGQAKALGTLTGVGGAMLLTFYKGATINLWSTHIDLLRSHHNGGGAQPQPHQDSGNHVKGSLFAVVSCLSYAMWLIIQTRMSKEYPCHYTGTALLCLMAAAQSVVYALCGERSTSSWRMGWDVRLLTTFYSVIASHDSSGLFDTVSRPCIQMVTTVMMVQGVVASGLILVVMSWCIKQRGPLFASIFSPLMLIIVALLSTFLMQEQLHLGSVIGSALIVAGLYAVLWGKSREATKVEASPPELVDVVVVDAGNATGYRGNVQT
ncbi:EamA-like transporter family [Musa troglodytarum]|uniref:EamA-like transporter family n=1 Tax=Musa troglodytarum TaxID=320322 RepID=A0A9E7K4X1_9LILI|nr:EamA-like transporter family [Musa troglodytarum]